MPVTSRANSTQQNRRNVGHQIHNTDWQTHAALLRRVRSAVFVDELGIPEDIEFDVEDPQAAHFIVFGDQAQPVGCARLLDSGQLGRVAVLPDYRHQRIGEQLVKHAVDVAQTRGLDRVFLNAQVGARAFYERLDFRIFGDEFDAAGIAHICMERPLAIAFTPPPIANTMADVSQPPNRIFASNKTPTRVSKLREFFTEEAALSGALQVIHGASRTVKLYSPELDHALFDTPDMVQMLSDFVRAAPSCRVEILIARSKPIVSRGHSLVELARRLDGKIALRRLPETITADAQSWLIADADGIWVQSEPDEYRGWSDTYNLVQAERFEKRFTQFWDRSVTDSELRLLRL